MLSFLINLYSSLSDFHINETKIIVPLMNLTKSNSTKLFFHENALQEIVITANENDRLFILLQWMKNLNFSNKLLFKN